jgi:tetratricopeptide (TPR) repeat protein
MSEQGVIAVPVWTGREASKLRAALRMSQRDYAAFLGVAPRTVANWDSKGRNTIIRPDLQSALDTALKLADQTIQQRFATFLQEDAVAPAADLAPHPDSPESAADWIPAQPGGPRLLSLVGEVGHPAVIPVGDTDIAVVQGMLDSLTAVDHQFGGGYARRAADGFLLEVVRPRLAVPGPGATLSQFRAAAAEFQMRVAWMHLDVADHDGARSAAEESFHLAQRSRDLAVCAWAMAMCSLLETWQGNTAAAVAYGHASVGFAKGGPPLVHAFAQGKLARALAAAGDRTGTQTALSQARSLFDAVQSHDDERVPRTIRDGYGPAYLLDEEAHCYRDLGENRKALDLSDQCLALRGADRFARNRAFATGNRALALARLGEVDEACDSAAGLLQLAATLDSSRVAQRLDSVLYELGPHRRVRAVAELMEQVGDTRIRRPGEPRLRTAM